MAKNEDLEQTGGTLDEIIDNSSPRDRMLPTSEARVDRALVGRVGTGETPRVGTPSLEATSSTDESGLISPQSAAMYAKSGVRQRKYRVKIEKL